MFFKKRTVYVATGVKLHLTTNVLKPLSLSDQIRSVLLPPKNTAEFLIFTFTFAILAIPLKNFSWNQGGEIWWPTVLFPGNPFEEIDATQIKFILNSI